MNHHRNLHGIEKTSEKNSSNYLLSGYNKTILISQRLAFQKYTTTATGQKRYLKTHTTAHMNQPTKEIIH
jgi:hypothetical protein